MWGLSEVLISYELIEYNEESSDDIEDSDKNDDTIEEDTLMHIYFNQKYDPFQCLSVKTHQLISNYVGNCQ